MGKKQERKRVGRTNPEGTWVTDVKVIKATDETSDIVITLSNDTQQIWLDVPNDDIDITHEELQ